MGNGVMTKEEKELFKQLGDMFPFKKPLQYAVNNAEDSDFRYQLIFGCSVGCGGDHTNHVHFGAQAKHPGKHPADRGPYGGNLPPLH